MDKEAILYALSTLAQTCAALAALVGAIGLYRLQTLKGMRSGGFYGDIAAMLGCPATAYGVLDMARDPPTNPNPAIVDLLRRFDALTPVIWRSRRWLAIFELWQLFAILISLVGFIFLAKLENCWYTSAGLAVLAIGSVGVTAGCVLAWFDWPSLEDNEY